MRSDEFSFRLVVPRAMTRALAFPTRIPTRSRGFQRHTPLFRRNERADLPDPPEGGEGRDTG